MNDKPFFDTNVILYAFRQTIRAVRWLKLCWPREEHYQFRS